MSPLACLPRSPPPAMPPTRRYRGTNANFLPDGGQELAKEAAGAQDEPVDPELIDRVAGSAGLTPAEAARVVQDVVAWYREPVEDYVRRRHAHHHLYGRRNPEAFELIAAELAGRVVAAPPLTQRQLRRIVYG
jgi:hypothetical protein